MINELNQRIEIISTNIIDHFLQNGNNIEITYDSDGNLNNQAQSAFGHEGLYAFTISNTTSRGLVYVGKSEKGDQRLYNHLTGKGKKGNQTAETLHTKHKYIKNAIRDDYKVWVSLYANQYFQKASLSCLEIECIIKGLTQLRLSFPNIKSWNRRNG